MIRRNGKPPRTSDSGRCRHPDGTTLEFPVVTEMLSSRELIHRDGTCVPLDVFIPEEQGRLLYDLVRTQRPKSTLEVGLANGISALFIAQALRDNGAGQHIAIDPFQTSDWGQAGLVALERAGLDDLVVLHEQLSHHAIPDLERDGIRIQFAFVDGSHLFDFVIADVLSIDRILDVGGLIAFDDSDWPAIDAAIRFTLANRRYEIEDTGVVIEPSRYRPSLSGRLLRAIGRSVPSIGHRLRREFLFPSPELGIRGRCVVLRKTGDDERDNQSRHFFPF